MAIILNIETSTTNCSVCIAENGTPLVIKEINKANYSHSEKLHVFIKEALKDASLSFDEIDAIAVSEGPGSYTGLRIGVSAAKGLCFSLDIPLIAIPTLQVLAAQLHIQNGLILALLDARRMEVYAAFYNSAIKEIKPTEALIITEGSFKDQLNLGTVHFIGNGAAKCKEVIVHENAQFYTGEEVPSSREMALLSFDAYKKSDFVDVAYFEPFYLKPFMLSGKK